MARCSLLAVLVLTVTVGVGAADQATKTPDDTGNISFRDGPLASTELYASGSDDIFAEYGIASYQFTPADFGVASVTTIDSLSWLLTQNGRGFSADGLVEFFYTPRDLNQSFDGIFYDNLQVGGVNPSDFGQLFSLGTQQYTSRDVFGGDPDEFPPGGEKDTYVLDIDGPALASLISEINAGSEFQLIIAAAELTTTATYSGNDNSFDPGDPELTILLAPPGLAGDFSDDGRVDAADYTVWRDNFGATEDGSVLSGNGDGGLVEDSDYDLWVDAFGAVSGGALAVPEPATALMAASSLAALLGRCRTAL